MWVEDIIVIIILAVLALEDIKHKSLDIRCIAVLGVISFGYGVFKVISQNGHISTMLAMAGVVFVVFLLVMSLVTKALGLGDVAVFCMLMVVKGVVFTVCTFMGAFVIMAGVCAFLLMFGKLKRKDAIAFVPFVWIASMGVMICA